jgi:predicted kinase
VYFLDEGITIVDCIEFSPRLRTCDVASELAFLTMDLDLHHAPELAAELAHTYAAHANDDDLLRLLPFYQCYRAYVRGKVESLKSREPEVPAVDQERARGQARRAFRLAFRYARGRPRPALVIVCGRIGTGKSTVAQLLNEHTGFSLFNSDVVRKRLAGLLPTVRANAAHQAGIYSEAFTRRTYATLCALAEDELRAERGVILDATCKQRQDRRTFIELGNRFRVPVLFLQCQASAAEVERRLRRREQEDNIVSDATWATALQEQDEFLPFDDLPAGTHFVVNTENTGEDALVVADQYLWGQG